MALPTLVDEAINGSNTGLLARNDTNFSSVYSGTNAWTLYAMPQQTAYKTVNTSGGAVTCNLATDTILYRADGGIFDDTQQAWISVDLTNVNPTPKKVT